MSYLDLPRLYFHGRFFTNPSTINNKLANFSPDVRLLPMQERRQSAKMTEEYAGFQYINPYGLHNFLLDNCVVSGAHGMAPAPVDGQVFGAIHSGVPYAKMVDLDPDQQSLSQIFGLALRVLLRDGSGFEGRIEPATLFDLWYGRVPTEIGDQMAAGVFQSLIRLENVHWLGPQDGLVQGLRERCQTGVSVKFMLDAYQGKPELPGFNYGRVVGVIGPGRTGEAINFPSERRLNPAGSVCGPAYCKLHRDELKLTLDLGNSMPLLHPAGESQDLGRLRLVALGEEGPLALHEHGLDYSRAALERSAGLVDLAISEAQYALLCRHPLAIQAMHFGATALLLQEHASLQWIHCEPTSLRLAPGESAIVKFHARHAGKAMPNQAIDLRLTAHEGNNRPRSGVEFPAQVVTDAHGVGLVRIEARSPQPLPPRRAVIDSQLYYIGGGSWQAAGELTRQSGGGVLSILVFNQVAEVAEPVWADHIAPILSYYARIYPGVAEVLGLDSYEGVRANAALLHHWLSLPREDPLHFPPSRDLAPAKARMICRWLETGMCDD
ncbi:hypothetical protein [Massilia sp. erpn]|uniref:hypothetical protein n=1 Tax=Massilia sp. erpn TaxID=2738142 RepID=UPI0021049453|nr:hypothetical protein [Massilia sp. erpn]UTY59475.1 hypothetical protein HPQ68_21235 [Massilia sp. erpn]